MARPRRAGAALAAALGAALLAPPALAAAGAQGPGDDEVAACVRGNAPAASTLRALRITRTDPRSGEKRIVVLRLYGRRDAQGHRRLAVRVDRPPDVAGSAMLLVESEAGSDVWLATPELPEPRKVTHGERSAPVFGTDLSYEDLEWLEGFRVPPVSGRRPDSKVGDRPVYVVETRPEGSSYGRVIAYVDKERCLPLRIELFEKGTGRLAKDVSSDPRSQVRQGDRWVAHELLVRDVRDLTSTHLLVDSHEQDVLLPDGAFTVEGLRRAVQEPRPPDAPEAGGADGS